jgi:hypothetical protein
MQSKQYTIDSTLPTLSDKHIHAILGDYKLLNVELGKGYTSKTKLAINP